jgi:hypothetical protein
MVTVTYRAVWRAEVFRSPVITDSVRVLLLAMAEQMGEDGRVSVPRSALAVLLGRQPRRVTERIGLAIDAGFLDRVTTGKPGVTAVYRATLPDGAAGRTSRGADCSHHSSASKGAPRRTSRGADGGPANQSGNVPDTVQLVDVTREALQKRLGRVIVSRQHAERVSAEILTAGSSNGSKIKNPVAYVRGAIEKDPAPERWRPTWQPPRFTAENGFEP